LFRLLPAERFAGGIYTRWKAPPCHGAHPKGTNPQSKLNRLAGHLRFCTISFPTARKVAGDIDNRAVSQILAGLSSDREF
jgi:hypothetical protein